MGTDLSGKVSPFFEQLHREAAALSSYLRRCCEWNIS
jgi:hypothetical protein